MPSILKKLIIQAKHHRLPHLPPPPPPPSPAIACGQPRDVTSNECLCRTKGRQFGWIRNGRHDPLCGQTTECCFEARSHQQGGRGGVKQTHPTAQIDGLCCSLSDIHTVTHRQGDGQEEVEAQTLFYTYSISRLTHKSTSLLGGGEHAGKQCCMLRWKPRMTYRFVNADSLV